jgi:hypothetical protein
LRALAAEVAASATPTAQARGLTVDVLPGDDDPVVVGDAFLLQRALANLVDNAIDFAPRASRITIEVVAHARSCDLVVRDRGPGIPEFAEGKVFEKFYSLARPATAKKSTGLGLSFVKEIADRTPRSLGGRRLDASLTEAMQTAWRHLRNWLTLGRWQRSGWPSSEACEGPAGVVADLQAACIVAIRRRFNAMQTSFHSACTRCRPRMLN